jgi:hypothetical protein
MKNLEKILTNYMKFQKILNKTFGSDLQKKLKIFFLNNTI